MADLLTAEAVRDDLGGVTHRDIDLARRIDEFIRSAR